MIFGKMSFENAVLHLLVLRDRLEIFLEREKCRGSDLVRQTEA
jgi:hypothetical protein